jgi:hypothetical protein
MAPAHARRLACEIWHQRPDTAWLQPLVPCAAAPHHRIPRAAACAQGVFVRRHQIAKETDNSPLTPADLAVGQTVTVYGRTFFLLDADAFTRGWYAQQLGLELGPAGQYPADPVDAYRQHFGLPTAPGACAHVRVCVRACVAWCSSRACHQPPVWACRTACVCAPWRGARRGCGRHACEHVHVHVHVHARVTCAVLQ